MDISFGKVSNLSAILSYNWVAIIFPALDKARNWSIIFWISDNCSFLYKLCSCSSKEKFRWDLMTSVFNPGFNFSFKLTSTPNESTWNISFSLIYWMASAEVNLLLLAFSSFTSSLSSSWFLYFIKLYNSANFSFGNWTSSSI